MKADRQNIEVKNLQLILSNLDSVQERFNHLNDLDSQQQLHYQQHVDNLNLLDDDIHGWHDLWPKLKQHSVLSSRCFVMQYASLSFLPSVMAFHYCPLLRTVTGFY